jgi:predicted metalloprotease with PDZ domain
MKEYIVVPVETKMFSRAQTPARMQHVLNQYGAAGWSLVQTLYETRRIFFLWRRDSYNLVFERETVFDLKPGQLGVRMEGQTVLTVAPGSPAQRAGILPGDHILKVDGTAIKGSADTTQLLGAPGSAAVITLKREGGNRDVVVEREK